MSFSAFIILRNAKPGQPYNDLLILPSHSFFFRLCRLRQLYIRIIVMGLNSTLTSSVDTNSSPQCTLRK